MNLQYPPNRLRRLSPIPGRLSQRYFGTASTQGNNGTVTVGTLYAMPFYIGHVMEFDQIAFCALGTASALFRMGIYTDNNGTPSKLLVDSGQVACDAAGLKTYTYALQGEGWVWLAGVGQSVAPSVSRAARFFHPLIGTPDPYGTAFGGMAYSQTGITGALPASWGSTYTIAGVQDTVPIIWLRRK